MGFDCKAGATRSRAEHGQSPGSGYETPYGPEKHRLTEEEKKANHVRSEKKRRFNVRSGMIELSQLIPDAKNDYKSEIKILGAYAKYVAQLTEEREMLVQKLEAKGITVEEHLKKT